MSRTTIQEFVDVAALRVGMFVYLDVGWLSHPFPRSSFRIASEEQIATIRSLGLKRLRWSSAQSELPATSAWVAPPPPPAPTAPMPLAAEGAPGSSQTRDEQRAERQRALAEQREALERCEQQFADATRDCKRVTELVSTQPLEAAAQAATLSKTLIDGMSGDRDLCIRLLTESAGDKASAHAMNVTVIALLMARAFGMTEADMLDLGIGALMHDIGKLELPERVRHREDHFSSAEARAYEEHVGHGVAHARRMALTPGATMVIAQHHEYADGTGFPHRLNTDRMSALARIVALVNRYDNLCNPYLAARALTPHEAVSLLFAQWRSRFDTAILGAFIKMMGVYPPGSTVQLTDDRYAMVVAVNSSRPLKPRVLVHDAGVPRDEALIVDLEHTDGIGIRRSLRPQMLPTATLNYLSPRPRVAYFFEPAQEPPPQE